MATLIETIVVLVLLGILAAVAIPRYMSMEDEARAKVTAGQIGAVKSRLVSVINNYMLAHNGNHPADGDELITYANAMSVSTCPTTDTAEGDFVIKCAPGAGREVVITISAVQGKSLTPAVTGSFRY